MKRETEENFYFDDFTLIIFSFLSSAGPTSIHFALKD